MSQLVAATIIQVIHIGIILFMLLLPYQSNDPDLLMLHVAASLTLIAHWAMGSNICSLTLFESHLRGIPMESSFMHRIVSPVYDISDKTLSDVCWVVTIINMFVSAYKLNRMAKQGVYPQVAQFFRQL